ncbi:MAG: hypothetical protein JKY52_20875 [Flavobacteriales bacterium]|nr:hypothetical protein [Flavobacteriales bacterium]
MNLKLCIGLLLISRIAFGQSNEAPDIKWSITTSPFSILGVYNGSLVNLGIEIKLKDNLSSYSEFGFYNSTPVFQFIMNQQGFIMKEAIKFYTDKQKLFGQGGYISMELGYSKSTYLRTDSIAVNQTPTYAKTYSISRKFAGISVHIGARKQLGSRIIIDFYTGAGIRLNMVKCNLSNSEARFRELGDWTNPSNFIEKCGTHIIPKFYLGLNVGYRLL